MQGQYFKVPKDIFETIIGYLKKQPFENVINILTVIQQQAEGPVGDNPMDDVPESPQS